MRDRDSEIEKARRYVAQCEDNITNALHCDDQTFKEASRDLRRAQIILFNLENKRA